MINCSGRDFSDQPTVRAPLSWHMHGIGKHPGGNPALDRLIAES